MLKDLKKVARPSRTKKGMQDFFIFLIVYSYYNRTDSLNNEFSIPQTVIADYFDCTTVTVKRWFGKLKELGYIQLAKRDNAGKTGYYKDSDGNKQTYTIPKYKKIRIGNGNEIKFLNVYELNQICLNKYLIDRVDIDVLGEIESYKPDFDKFIKFLVDRKHQALMLEEINTEEDLSKLSGEDKKIAKKMLLLQEKVKSNKYYLDKKHELEHDFPEFVCKYLEEGCLRLTHELCNTVNPEHTDKINENNYWRSSKTRTNMLESLLHTSIDNIIEYDVNGSIYRLTYNLNHEECLNNHIDIYELIWNNCNFNITWKDDKKEDFRLAFKKLLMPIYMRPNSIAYRANQWEYIDKYFAGRPRKYSKLSKEDKNMYETYNMFVNMLNLDITTILNTIRDSMYKTLNTKSFLQSDVFTYESNLHILMRYNLMKRNIKSVNIYDGFYFIKDDVSEQIFYEVYNESIKELKLHLE